MPDRIVTTPNGKTQRFPSDATDAEISEALNTPPATGADGAQPRGWMDTLKDVGAGFVKGATGSVKAVADDLPHMFGGAGLSDYIDQMTGRTEGETYRRVDQGIKATNTPQMVGKGLEMATEIALPLSKAADAVPRTSRAAGKFKEVMGAAKSIPIDVEGPGQAALRIQQLADRGGTLPVSVRKFLGRVTDPDKAAMTYEEARDFYSNISRLSANEYGRLTPAVAREVAGLRVALNASLADAAKKAGKAAEYSSAMREYAQAMKVKDAIESVAKGAKQALPYATAAGAGYWLTSRLRRLIGSEE